MLTSLCFRIGNFSEIITFSFQSQQAHELLSSDTTLKISNSISEDHAFMRSSMLFNHLESLENNRKKGLNKFSVFEIGPIYNDSKSLQITTVAPCHCPGYYNTTL